MLEGPPDRDDPVDLLVELLPTLQQNPLGPRALRIVEEVLDVQRLILAQGQADDIHVILFFERAHHRRAPPPATDVEQRHARLESQLSQRQIDLRDLRLFQRQIVALEVGTAVGLSPVQEQSVEVVGQVVMVLHIVEVRLHLR